MTQPLISKLTTQQHPQLRGRQGFWDSRLLSQPWSCTLRSRTCLSVQREDTLMWVIWPAIVFNCSELFLHQPFWGLPLFGVAGLIAHGALCRAIFYVEEIQ